MRSLVAAAGFIPLRIWYRAPASDHPLLPARWAEARPPGRTAEWVRALPVGNGRLGAMVFGGAGALDL